MILSHINDCRIQYNQMIVMTLALCCIVLILIIVQSEELQDNQQLKPFIKWTPQVDKVFFYQLDDRNWTHVISDRFLSFSIDSSEIYHGFRNPSLNNKKLTRLVSHLSGGYLRIGGTTGDRVVFTPAYRSWPNDYLPLDSGLCGYEGIHCPNITSDNTKIKPVSMSAKDWMDINGFCEATGMKLLFGLNALLRTNNSWDPRNAELLLDFSLAQGYHIDWELGNEPNLFNENFGVNVSAGRLAIDYTVLKQLLYRYSLYKDSSLSGPSSTKTMKMKKIDYLHDFLANGADVDAVSFHLYNMGPNVTVADYLDPANYDSVRDSINLAKLAMKEAGVSSDIPLWIGETGSSYGGGAVNLSDRFIASLLHLDKLGIAASNGVSHVVRQSLYRGNYRILDPDSMTPLGDFWVSVLFKKLVGKKVLNISEVFKDSQNVNHTIPLRLYAHCSTTSPHPVIYGVNLNNETLGISLLSNTTGDLYSVKGYPDLLSQKLELNGNLLNLSIDQALPSLTPVTLDLREPVPVRPYSLFFLLCHYNLTVCESTPSS